MVAVKDYFMAANHAVDKARKAQRDELIHMAQVLGDVMLDNGVIQLFGYEQDRAFSMELGYRAGGLMPYHQINVKDLVLRGIITEEEMKADGFYNRKDLAKLIWDTYNIAENDVFLMYVTADTYDSVLDLAKMAKDKGHRIFLVGSKEGYAKGPYQENSKQLLELADEYLDLCIEYPDTVLTYKEQIKITQVANVVGNIFAQMLTAEIYRYLTENGHEAPVLLSANVTGADVHNKAIAQPYEGRWNS